MLAVFSRFKKYLSNSAWLVTERVTGFGVVSITAIFVARYLGPKDFGLLAYAASMASFFAAAGHMGLGGLVVRELVKEPQRHGEILATAFGLKVFDYGLGFLILFTVALLSEEQGSIERWVIVLVASSILLRPLEVIDFWFQSQVQAKYAAISQMSGTLFSSAFKLLLVAIGAQLLVFGAANLLQAFVSGSCLLLLFLTRANNDDPWRFDRARAKDLLSEGWLIFAGSMLAIVYLKADQVMLRWFVGAAEVGIYSVAATLSEAWYFLSTALVASVYPRLIELREQDGDAYPHRLQQLFDVLFTLALGVAILVTLIAQPLMFTLFGEDYAGSAPILSIHIWAALFVFMRAAFSRWILIEGHLVLSLLTQGLGAMVNIFLNIALIPFYGGLGAAIATLISYAIASYFSLAISRKSRPVFWMMSKAFLTPLRYGTAIFSWWLTEETKRKRR